ncbi:unnamed protein product [Enterobius vermicularis]|uniref:Homeobox domain-containing protein n=1 Tax=Enterobius vermicularis TaxID=51028 RepID=A0A0N4V4R6_ENTVE|nr:unnamed protein product [Enterobius vermicularis]
MSNPVIATEGPSSTQPSRKRGSPNTVNLRRGAVSTSSVAQGEESGTSQDQGAFNTPGPSTETVDAGERVVNNRHSRQSRFISKELRYLTDFFPDQEPSDRRLTRSQRQLSAPSSPATNSAEINYNLNSTSSVSSPLPQQSAGKERTTRGRKGRGSLKLLDSGGTSTESDSQPGTSSAARHRGINTATTGLCNSVVRCEGTSNRVFPSGSSSALAGQHDADFRLSSQGSAIPQVNETGHFRPLPGEGVIQIAGSARSSTESALDGSAAATIGAYNLSSDTHHDHGVPLRTQATHSASSFLGTLIPRVHHLLGTSHSHPSLTFMERCKGARIVMLFMS